MPLDPRKLKSLRQRRKLTQGELAERIGVARPNYVAMETGRNPNPSLPTLEALASALGVGIGELVTASDSR